MPFTNPEIIGNCASLAALLEVSAYPKPGNVHRINDFPGTSYEHFLAGSVTLGTEMSKLAQRTIKVKDLVEIRLGKSILESVDEMFRWQRGGNIHLGVILIFAPITAGAALAYRDDSKDHGDIRAYTRRIVESASPMDSVDLYAAIDRAMSSENLGSAEDLDVKDQKSAMRIRKENITPLQVFENCSERDLICSEWVTGFKIVFDTGYTYLKKRIDNGATIKDATVDTFLKILSENQDSLITRKKGPDAANKISREAKRILDAGGIKDEKGEKLLWDLDQKLKETKGALNPGTTADITAASLFVLLLSGWRP